MGEGLEPDRLCRALLLALTRQREGQALLLEQVERLRDAVVRRDPAAVRTVAGEQQETLAGFESFPERSQRAAQALAVRLGLAVDVSPTILAQHLAVRGYSDLAAELRLLTAAVQTGAAGLRRANALNALLLRQALAFTAFGLRLLTQADAEGYTEAGTARVAGQRPMLDASG